MATTGPTGRVTGTAPTDMTTTRRCCASPASITFELGETGRSVTLQAGERLDLPAGTDHAALVGPSGVRCHETHLPAGTFDRGPMDPA